MAKNEMVQSVLKALDILTLIGKSSSGMRLSEVADKMAMKIPTAHNLIRSLVDRGYLEKSPRNIYKIGIIFHELSGHLSTRNRDRLITTEMGRLHQVLPECVITHAKLENAILRVTHRMSYDRPNIMQHPDSMTFSLYGNASGLVTYSFVNEETKTLLLEHYPFSEFGIQLWNKKEKLDAFAEETLKKGYSILPFDTDTSFRVAVPVFDQAGGFSASLGVSIPIKNLEDNHQEIIEELKTSASKL